MEFETKKLFYSDPYQTEFEAKVLSIEGNKVILDQTCFYPEGGGQVGDTGFLNGIRVLDTVKEDAQVIEIDGQRIPAGGKTVHIMEKEPGFSVGDTVKGKIDWDRRYKIMKLHSASHILEHFLFKVFGEMPRVGSRVDQEKDRSDYETKEKFSPEKIAEVHRLCNEFIAGGHEIITKESEKKHIRVWESNGLRIYCGGTHPKNTKEIGSIRLKRLNKGSGCERVETYLTS